MSPRRTKPRPLRTPLLMTAVLMALLVVAGCGGDDEQGPAGAAGGATGVTTDGGGTDVLEDAALGRDIGVSIRDTGGALTRLPGCGRRLSCYRAEGAQIARFAAEERARLAPPVARAQTGCVRDTGRLQLDLLAYLERAGTELATEDYPAVIRSSAGLVRRADDVTGVARDCAEVVIP